MFWTKVEKERLKRAYRARMSQAISGLEAMDISGLSQVYCAVATEDRELIRSGGRAIGMVMGGDDHEAGDTAQRTFPAVYLYGMGY